MAEYEGRLELTWTNKGLRLLTHEDGTYEWVPTTDYRVAEVRLLHDVATVGECRPADDRAADNLLIRGDALHGLTSLIELPEFARHYVGKVKLCYIDPPFNTGQAFAQYDDALEHSVWLTMLRDRLVQVKELLTDDGSVWVHLDDAEVHRARCVLDEVFGAEDFVGTVAWQKVTSPRNDTTGLSGSQDYILVYSRTDSWSSNRMDRLASSNTSRYKSRDGDPVPWRDGDATAGKAATNHPMVYAIQHPVTAGLMYPTPGRCWGKAQSWFLEQLNQYAKYELRDIGDEERRAIICATTPAAVKQGVPAIMLAEPLADAASSARARHAAGLWPDLVFLDIEKERLQRKKHLVDDGRVPETLWLASEVGGSLRGKNQVKDLFPDSHAFATPKPEELIERVIRIGTNPGDIVLDCFAGSGTTAAVAHKMGRRWVTIELSPDTLATFAIPRLRKVVEGTDPGGITTAATEEFDGDLPDGMDAKKVREGASALAGLFDHGTFADIDGLDEATVNKIALAMRKAGKVRQVTTTQWSGGGGFRILDVVPSMFEEDEGLVVLSDWAANGALGEATAAQLGYEYESDPPFVGRKGRTRLAVIDGLVNEPVVRLLANSLSADEKLVACGTAIDPAARQVLKDLRPGSTLRKIPASLLDEYRVSRRRSRLVEVIDWTTGIEQADQMAEEVV